MGNEDLKMRELEGWLEKINERLADVLKELREIKKEIGELHRDMPER